MYLGLKRLATFFRNPEESVYGNGRGGDRSQNGHYSSHNPGECGILLFVSVAYRPVHEKIHGNEIGYISGDGGSVVFRSR